ncbi:MAG: glycosyltransferase family 1 protein [Anaerolineae bacterium]
MDHDPGGSKDESPVTREGAGQLRIGFDITVLYVAEAGVFYYTYNLIRALLGEDQENDYLLLDYYPIHGGWKQPTEPWEVSAANAEFVRRHGLRHRRLADWRPMRRGVLRSASELVDRALFRPWSAAADAIMRRRLMLVLDGVDVLHSSDVLLWRQPGALNVITIYDLTALLFPEYHTARNRELQERKLRFAQQEADVVIAISEATKRDVVTHLGIPAERVHVVYGGVDAAMRPVADSEVLARALAPMGLDPGGYILNVGTIEPRKNLVRLVEAYSRVRKMMPAPVPKLVLAGAKGWHFEEVFERVDALGLQDQVLFTGRVGRHLLPLVYNGAVLFVYASLYEGFGLPVLEAMACGVPVVASNISSLPEIVGEAGVLVDPTDTDELASSMADLLGDRERRLELRAAGLARAGWFSWERAAQETLGVYEGALRTVLPP